MPQNKKITVLLVEDQDFTRRGIATFINEDEELSLVGEAENAAGGFELINKLKPNVAVIDVKLPDSTGLELSKKIKHASPETEIVIFTDYNEEEYFLEAMNIEITGYVLKDQADELITAIKKVNSGEPYITPKLHKSLLNRYEKIAKLKKDKPRIAELTPQETKVLKHVADLKSNQQIAGELFIAVNTVENHRVNICKKLDLRGRNALLVFALQNKHLL